jgi:20S proteasome subunit beta 6
MPLRAIARLIQTMLYAKRFFPYYVYNILGGIEEDGQWRLFLTLRLRPFISISPSLVNWSGCVTDAQSIGSGAVYSFDPVGSYEREACRAAGAAQSLVQPFLDNQVSQIYPRHLGTHSKTVRR